MSIQFRKPTPGAVPIHVVDRAGLAAAMQRTDANTRRWLTDHGFDGKPGSIVLVPDARAALGSVWAGVTAPNHPHALAALPGGLPPGTYRLGSDGLALDAQAAALSWRLGAYRYTRYKTGTRATAAPTLQLAPTAAARRGALLADAVCLVRDLVNAPAEDLGPVELGEAARALAQTFGASCRQIVGDRLLGAGFPAIHAVGRASTRAPRLIELTWGPPRARAVTIVGKGVCFDTGGLDLKTADGMRMMKKDMGGAAHALALAQLVMASGLPVRLRVLIPAVDNAVAGNAMRPGDVIRTRTGRTVEVGNTDAEGRLVLCDALAYGAERKPELMIDLATLTGAARVALGPRLPALYCRDMALARALVDRGLSLHDPVWHLPLWEDYHAFLDSDVADVANVGRGPFAGSILAALFLADFVPSEIDWLHLDLYAWNELRRPGVPIGGEAQGLMTLLAYLEQRFGVPSTA